MIERVETRLVQIDVSVIDPKGESYASVPGITLDQFDIRIDGERLAGERLARVKLDEICDEPSAAGARMRPVVAVIDFNYVDARGREKVAEAIEALAGDAASKSQVYKFYALTRQVRQLSEGFTRDPERLKQVATMVRSVSFRGDEGAKLTAAEAAVRSRDGAFDSLIAGPSGGCSG